jgi:hypothetical protein
MAIYATPDLKAVSELSKFRPVDITDSGGTDTTSTYNSRIVAIIDVLEVYGMA